MRAAATPTITPQGFALNLPSDRPLAELRNMVLKEILDKPITEGFPNDFRELTLNRCDSARAKLARYPIANTLQQCRLTAGFCDRDDASLVSPLWDLLPGFNLRRPTMTKEPKYEDAKDILDKPSFFGKATPAFLLSALLQESVNRNRMYLQLSGDFLDKCLSRKWDKGTDRGVSFVFYFPFSTLIGISSLYCLGLDVAPATYLVERSEALLQLIDLGIHERSTVAGRKRL
jgi:hypothetical protein